MLQQCAIAYANGCIVIMESPQPFDIAVESDVVLRGLLWSRSATWIVLVHEADLSSDLDCWRPLVPYLLRRGWSVLAIDLRGHGASDGDWDTGLARHDLLVLFDHIRTVGGATLVFGVAVGQSGLHMLENAENDRFLDAMALLSPVIDDNTETGSLRGTGQAKLFICGGHDLAQRRSAERLRNASIGWATILNLPTTGSGAELLAGRYGLHALEQITGFFAEQAFLAHSRSTQIRAMQRMRNPES